MIVLCFGSVVLPRGEGSLKEIGFRFHWSPFWGPSEGDRTIKEVWIFEAGHRAFCSVFPYLSKKTASVWRRIHGHWFLRSKRGPPSRWLSLTPLQLARWELFKKLRNGYTNYSSIWVPRFPPKSLKDFPHDSCELLFRVILILSNYIVLFLLLCQKLMLSILGPMNFFSNRIKPYVRITPSIVLEKPRIE